MSTSSTDAVPTATTSTSSVRTTTTTTPIPGGHRTPIGQDAPEISTQGLANAIISAQANLAMKGPVSMPKFGNREDEEIGIFLRRYEQAGLAQNWTHADLLQRLPLSLTHGASSWHSRVAIPANWQDVKALMLREFRPHGYLEYKQKALVRRMMLQGESVNDYYEAVMLLYDIMESLGKSFTDQEKADKLGSGLHGTLYKDVAMMSPTSPQDFLMKTGKAIDLEKKAQRQQRGFRDQALPNTIKDPIMDENNGVRPPCLARTKLR